MKKVYLEKDQVPEFLRGIGGYNGRKFDAVVTTEVTFTNTNWGGGSRCRYTGVQLNGTIGRSFGGSDMPAPWNNPVEGKTVEIPPGCIIVEHCLFRGKDMGLTFYVRPENAAALLPESTPDEIPLDQMIVLVYTRNYKNSYGGRKDIRFSEASDERYGCGITRERWDAALSALIASGHLRKNGSITPKGLNAGTKNDRELARAIKAARSEA